jgi:hypothetical protein
MTDLKAVSKRKSQFSLPNNKLFQSISRNISFIAIHLLINIQGM